MSPSPGAGAGRPAGSSAGRPAALVVRDPGGLCLVQDAGRPGLAAMGVGCSGAADRASYELGNRLVGNPEGAAALEVVLGGLEVEAEGTCWVAVTGAPCPVRVAGRIESPGTALLLRPGQRLRLGAPGAGVRSYLAVRGGVAVEPVLGSRSTDTLAAIGPEPIARGQRLPIGTASGAWTPWDAAVAPPGRRAPLRVVRGPRADRIEQPGRLVAADWAVASDSDRVGVRLQGEPLRHRAGAGEVPSEGALRGAIQVPPDGAPVIFGADHPVTGGYPVIGVIVDADTDRLAQLRPGDPVRFRWA